MAFRSTKTFTHALGLSCAFRQWRADSHCRFVHGYALEIRVEFEADTLDERGWVVDFGALKALRETIARFFDHKVVVAQDDPHLDWFTEAQRRGIAEVIVVPAVGCERFAEFVHGLASAWLEGSGGAPRVRVALVEVREHGGNSAVYTPE